MKYLIVIVAFHCCLFLSAQVSVNDSLINAAREGDLAKVKQTVEQGADVNYLGSEGYTSVEITPSLEVVKYLHEKGAKLSEVAYFEHSMNLNQGYQGDHLEIMKYLIDNKVIKKDDLYFMSDDNLSSAVYFPEYISFLEENKIKFNKKKYNKYMQAYFNQTVEELIYYSKETTLENLKYYLRNGIGCKSPFSMLTGGDFNVPNVIDYIYFLDSLSIKLDSKQNKKDMDWTCYEFLAYSYSNNDTGTIDFMLWLAGKGFFKHSAISCFGEMSSQNYAMEVRFLEGLESRGYSFGFKDDRETLKSVFNSYFWALADGVIDYTYLTRYAKVFKNEKDPLFFISEAMDIKQDIVFKIILAMNHDNNRVAGKNFKNAIDYLYSIYSGEGTSEDFTGFINTPMEDGKTILMVAAELCDFESIKYLVEAGANTSHKDDNGKQAKDYTICEPIISYLNSH